MTASDGALATRRASLADRDEIVALLQANEAAQGGSLTGHFDRAGVAALLVDMPVMIARRGGDLVGVLISGSKASAAGAPVIARMLEAYRGGDDTYVYGPICVAAGERGKGIAELLFAALKRTLPGREGILFIRQDNFASLRVHRDKLGMVERATFEHDGIRHVVLSYRG